MFSQNRRRSAKTTVDAALHAALQTHLVGEDQMSFQLLLRHVRFRSLLLSTASEPWKQGAASVVLAGLVEIARRRGGWLRPIHKWFPPQESPFVQFRSLVKHLFARYRVPNFMASVWLCPQPEAATWLDLFLHLGRGKSIRQFVVLDIGTISGRGWAVVEANAAWGSGIYGCDPMEVLGVIRHATKPKM